VAAFDPEPAGAAATAADDAAAAGARPERTAARLERAHADADARTLLARVLSGGVLGRTALVSSFGADSAVLLHLVAQIDRATPVLFVDSGKLFDETLAYRDRLVDELGLTAVRTVAPSAAALARGDPAGARHAHDPDGCCGLRKVAPLAAALDGFDAWLTGRRRHQAATRARLARFETDAGGRIKLNPLADWSAADAEAYRARHRLPRHPLVDHGYASIGCAPCTTPVAPGEDPRAGRWRHHGKTECGLHLDGGRLVRGGG
jgi:phosphoadenosine phosphosulfate reductase